MDQAQLAAQLAEADDAQRAVLLQQHAALLGVALAHTLKQVFDANESSNPSRAIGSAAALTAVANMLNDSEARALAAWTAGMAAQLDGRLEDSVTLLADAEARFLALAQPHTAASTQVSQLIGLAMLGRYDEAIATGLQARDVFLAHNDMLAAGKIEQNLGNVYRRREQYGEAEHSYRAAYKRFEILLNQKELAKVENNLANVLSAQHDFRTAELLLTQALMRAEAATLDVTQAEIECNIGSLALFQGKYDQALDYLERSRRKYAALNMCHESAIAEQEIADAYLELNLVPEAAAMYERVVPTLNQLGMRAEQARALAYHGRAALAQGQLDRARELLAEARTLYEAEENIVGAALVRLTEAQILYVEGHFVAAATAAAEAERPLTDAGAWVRLLTTRWLRGEATRAAGQHDEARGVLHQTLQDAQHQGVPQIAQRCHTSLGLLAAATGDTQGAEAAFKQAAALIETMRAPLPAEDFRTAFVADKLTPYAELVRLCLADGSTVRVHEALDYVERSRSRALVDMLGGALERSPNPDDPAEAALLARLQALREDLNWFYNQANRPPDGETTRGAAAMTEIHTEIRDREGQVLELTRQLQQHGGTQRVDGQEDDALDLAQLQRNLGTHTAVVEYFTLDDEVLAFVVTDQAVNVVRHLARVEQVEAPLQQLRFQIDALRHGARHMRRHLPSLTTRTQQHLRVLHNLLIMPLAPLLGERRLAIVPHRSLHYVPFHALYDGIHYLIETREVCYAPSANVLQHCLAQPRRQLQRAVVFGVPDAQIPHVRGEVAAITPLFDGTVTLLDDQATIAALHKHAPAADVLHLACHGYFRPDNPLFSSLRLHDEWLTVRDAASLDLHCGLVTLSACETGISAVAPGDELIGLARGFLRAGTPSLLVSLWTVDDEATAQLMNTFYTRLRAGDGPAAALRHAQRALIITNPHPYFWSPFVLLGSW